MLKHVFVIQKTGITLFERKFEQSIYEFKDLITAFFSVLIVFTERSAETFGEIRELRCSSVKLLFDTSKDMQFFVVLVVDQFDKSKPYKGVLTEIRQRFAELYRRKKFRGRIGTYDEFRLVIDKLVKENIPDMLFDKDMEEDA